MTLELLTAVTELATLSGNEAHRHFRTGVAVEIKGDGSPVTVADRAAETVARDWIRTHVPNDGILGEEFGLEKPDARRRWILDPIDGTKSFIHGVPLWGTLVAVVEGESVLAGAVYSPPMQELVAAASGQGAWWNGKRTHVSTTSALAEATLLVTDDRFAGRPQRQARWETLARASGIVRTWGDCYGYLLLATGWADLCLDPIMNPWDIAALVPVIRGAGGVITDWHGGAAYPAQSTIAAATPALHAATIAALAK